MNIHISHWMHAIRPKTLWAAICPVLLAGIYAWHTAGQINIYLLIVLVTAILIQIATNLVNDLEDGKRGTDLNRVGPTRVTASGLIAPARLNQVIWLIVVLCIVLGLILVFRGGIAILLIGLAALLCVFWYSKGPLSLSYSGLADFFVLVFFGPLATFGTYYILTLEWNYTAALIGLAPGFISIAILTVNNARDYQTDIIASKKTLVARFGLKFAKYFYVLCLVLACFLAPIIVLNDAALWLAGIVTYIFAVPVALKFLRAQKPEDYMPLLPRTAKLLVVYLVLFFLGSWV